MTTRTPHAGGASRGFKRASHLLKADIRKAGEARGFAVAKLLTHWREVVGEEIAAIARPVNISYGKGGFGATLTVLTKGAQAPMLQMQLETLKERVNACYGYAAIRHVRITQTAPTGFAEGQAEFAPAPKLKREPDAAATASACAAARGVGDEDLRAALERLGANVISRTNRT